MAKGRFLSKQITIDKRVNDLKDPWSMLGFSWLIPHADREGRVNGDPAVLKSLVFPRQNGNISIEFMENLAISWQNAGLIIYYEDENDRYIQLVNFEKHQTGLRKDREPASIIPGFNPDSCRIVDGKKRVKLSKGKLSKDNTPEKPSGKNAPSKEEPKPSKNNELEDRMINKFTEITGIKMMPTEYAKNQTLWYKPVRHMLFQVDNDIGEAESLLEYAIAEMKKIPLNFHTPNSVISTFDGVIGKEKNNGH